MIGPTDGLKLPPRNMALSSRASVVTGLCWPMNAWIKSSNVWEARPDLALCGELLAFERKAWFAAFIHRQPFAKTPGMRVSASQTVEGR